MDILKKSLSDKKYIVFLLVSSDVPFPPFSIKFNTRLFHTLVEKKKTIVRIKQYIEI